MPIFVHNSMLRLNNGHIRIRILSHRKIRKLKAKLYSHVNSLKGYVMSRCTSIVPSSQKGYNNRKPGQLLNYCPGALALNGAFAFFVFLFNLKTIDHHKGFFLSIMFAVSELNSQVNLNRCDHRMIIPSGKWRALTCGRRDEFAFRMLEAGGGGGFT